MATNFVIACPECSKQVRVTDEHIGKKIRCKGCGKVFPVPAAGAGAAKTQAAPPGAPKTKAAPPAVPKTKAAPPDLPSPAAHDDDYDPNKYVMEADLTTLPRCPFCAKEMASADALICLHCGYNTRTRNRPEVKQVYGHTAGELFLWWLPAILAILTMIGMWVWYLFFWDLIEEWLKESIFEDEPGPPPTYIGGLSPGMFRLYHALLIVFLCVPLVRFTYKRLVINNRPDERKIKDEWEQR